MSDSPTFSFLLPTYRRIGALAVTLDHLAPFASDDCEIVVIDDCSPEDDVERLCKARGFPKYHKLPRNLGTTGARNVGYSLMKGRFLISLDDDSYPITPDFLNAVKSVFAAHPAAGALALNILTPDGSYSIPPRSKAVQGACYIGCGAVWTRGLYERIGAYTPVIMWQGEEMEHSMRIIGAGLQVINCPDIVIKHDESVLNRNVGVRVAHDVANSLKRGILRAPWPLIPLEILRFLAVLALRFPGLDRGVLWAELTHGERGIVQAIKLREPVSMASYNHFYALRRNDWHNTFLGRLLGAKAPMAAARPAEA